MGLGGRYGFRAGTLRRGKHRTEVTEATEGIKRLGGEWVGRRLRLPCGNHGAGGKHRTEVTEATEGVKRLGG